MNNHPLYNLFWDSNKIDNFNDLTAHIRICNRNTCAPSALLSIMMYVDNFVYRKTIDTNIENHIALFIQKLTTEMNE